MKRKALVVIVWRPEPTSAEKQVLLLKMRPDRGGHWQPVTGSVEEGEDYAEGALREAEEETGFRFERRPQFMGMEYEFDGRWGPARERAFLLPLLGGEAPPTPTLDPKEHVDFSWVSPAQAQALVHFDTNRRAIERATQNLPPLFLSRAGSFFQEGEEITHERTAELLHRGLERTPSGNYLVRLQGEEIDVVVEDLARFVRSYDRATGMLFLSHGEEEKLKPETLEVREDNSFACTLGSGLKAVFLSGAYYEIAKDVEEGSASGEYVLNFLGRRERLRVAH